MKWLILCLILAGAQALAYTDSDMDGVEDAYDKCPQTSFSDLVNLDGCPISSTQREAHYDLMLGVGYSQMNYNTQESADTITKTLQADYYYKKWWLQLLLSHYKSSTSYSSDSGMDDTNINLYYKLTPSEKLSLNIGAGVVLPTYKSGYDNEATDYAVSLDLKYFMTNRKYLLGGYRSTLVMDRDVATVLYQNTSSFYLGAGYSATSKLSLNTSYSQSQSIYKGTQAFENIGVSGFYQIDSNWFTTANYQYGLSDSTSKHNISLQLGYYF